MTDTVVHIGLAPRCRLTVATALAFGLTVKAVQCKIAAGKWIDGREYHRDPDGNIWLDQRGIMQWVAPARA